MSVCMCVPREDSIHAQTARFNKLMWCRQMRICGIMFGVDLHGGGGGGSQHALGRGVGAGPSV